MKEKSLVAQRNLATSIEGVRLGTLVTKLKIDRPDTRLYFTSLRGSKAIRAKKTIKTIKTIKHAFSMFYSRNRKHFGRMRNAVGTRAASECFHCFFQFSQTFTSVHITRQKHGEHVFFFFQKTLRRKIGKQLVNFDYQNVNSLSSRHHYVNSSGQFRVSIE